MKILILLISIFILLFWCGVFPARKVKKKQCDGWKSLWRERIK